MTKHLSKNLRRDLDLLWMLTHKEIALQYKRTFLGIFWSLLNPLLLAAIFYIAFIIILKMEKKDFPLFLLAALFPWTWFSSSVGASTVSMISNKSLIKKYPFPKHFLPTAVVFSQGVHFLFSLPIIALLVYSYGKTVHLIWFLGIPLLLIIQFLMTVGVCFIVSVVNVYFMDFQFIVSFFLNLLFWVTPIIYQLDTIPAPYRSISFYANPLTPLMSSWRELFLSNRINWIWMAMALFAALITFLAGLLIFRRLNRRLDEII